MMKERLSDCWSQEDEEHNHEEDMVIKINTCKISCISNIAQYCNFAITDKLHKNY